MYKNLYDFAGVSLLRLIIILQLQTSVNAFNCSCPPGFAKNGCEIGSLGYQFKLAIILHFLTLLIKGRPNFDMCVL